ncbi:MAG: hypothetical protein IKN43_04860 [Selenomonadaceae bacterium]|nr:hypothetical protein [Selenomonadaceae bacterium]
MKFKYKYDPDMFDSLLREYMIKAYKALEENDAFHYRMACIDITHELKWSWENEIIGKAKADEIADYFWEMAE